MYERPLALSFFFFSPTSFSTLTRHLYPVKLILLCRTSVHAQWLSPLSVAPFLNFAHPLHLSLVRTHRQRKEEQKKKKKKALKKKASGTKCMFLN